MNLEMCCRLSSTILRKHDIGDRLLVTCDCEDCHRNWQSRRVARVIKVLGDDEYRVRWFARGPCSLTCPQRHAKRQWIPKDQFLFGDTVLYKNEEYEVHEDEIIKLDEISIYKKDHGMFYAKPGELTFVSELGELRVHRQELRARSGLDSEKVLHE